MPPIFSPAISTSRRTVYLQFERLEDRTVPTFAGGVSVAAGDWDSDGFVDIVTGAGPGGGPQVKVFSGQTGEVIASLFAYDVAFSGGVTVAVADVTGDRRLDLITGAGAGGSQHVRVFDGTTLRPVFERMAFDLVFTGGVNVAAADLDGDGRAEVICGAGVGGGPHVRAFSVASGAVVRDFMAFDPAGRGGVSVAAGDITGDGVPEIVAGSGPGGPAVVRAFSGAGLTEAFQVTAYDPAWVSGTRVAVGDLNADGRGEVLTGAMASGGPHVRAFFTSADLYPTPAGNFFAYDQPFRGGVFLASADVDGDGQADVVTGAGQGGGPHVRAFRSTDARLLADFMAYDPDLRSGGFIRSTSNPPSSSSPSAAVAWNDVLLTQTGATAAAPPEATRAMAVLNTAVLDVRNSLAGRPGYTVTRTAIDPRFPPNRIAQVQPDESAAVAAAARAALRFALPMGAAAFDAEYARQLAAIPDGAAKTAGVTLGEEIAAAVVELRADDGALRTTDFPSGTTAGEWRPTPPMFAEEQLPQWATVRPFVLARPDEFRPAAPPAVGSAAWQAAFDEVKAVGESTSSTRTPEQTDTAILWADGAGTATPPGHWLRIALDAAKARNLDADATARMLAALSLALADSSVAAWDAKYTYGTWRPVTAVRENGSPDWTPLLVTPNHPEYVSGHSSYSRAAAAVLESFLPGYSFTTTGIALGRTVTRSYASFDAAATDAGRSRVFGGIHFEFSNQAGQALGKQVADAVLATFATGPDTTPPTVTFTTPAGPTNVNLTINGRVNDRASRVASLAVSVDGGAAVDVPIFSLAGRFTFPTALATDGTADGPHKLTFTAADAAGNASSTDFTFTLDTRGPTLAVTTPTDGESAAGAATLAGTVGAGAVSLVYSLDEPSGPKDVPVTFDPAGGAFSVPVDLRFATPGTRTLTVTATDAAGNATTTARPFTLTSRPTLSVLRTLPADGAADVGPTFRPRVFFSRPVAAVDGSAIYAVGPDGTTYTPTVTLADDKTSAWVYFPAPLPGSSALRLVIDGSRIVGAADNAPLDAAGTGTPGSRREVAFTTASRTATAALRVQQATDGVLDTGTTSGTTVTGVIADPGADLKPGTTDDVRVGADGRLMTPDDEFRLPLAGVKVFALGNEAVTTTTDAQGRFTLSVPAGTVKLAIDGRTATNPPAGVFFPEMVMDLEIEPGLTNTVMGSMGTAEQRTANELMPGVYLPRVNASTLTDATGGTTLTADAAAAPTLTPEQRAGLRLGIPAGTTILGENGAAMTSARVGVSTVPVELVREMLPQGVPAGAVDFAITIQAPGVTAFATPLPLTVPNTSGAAPGTKLQYFSFDHTTGRLEIEGTATVSADGKTVTTDPGQGITHPGWHGTLNPGSEGSGGPDENDETGTPDDDPCPNDMVSMNGAGQGGSIARSAASAIVTPEIRALITGNGGQQVYTRQFSPPSGTVDPQCGPTQELEVIIEYDGPALEFLDLSGTARESRFVLKAGETNGKTFTLTARDLMQMFPEGVRNKVDSRIYAAEVTITERLYDPAAQQSSSETVTKIQLYRFIDFADATADTTITFPHAQLSVSRQKTIQTYTGASTRPTPNPPSASTNFQATGGGNIQITFSPIAIGTQSASLQFTNPAGTALPFTIGLSGQGVDRVTYRVDEASLRASLSSAFNNPALHTIPFVPFFPQQDDTERTYLGSKDTSGVFVFDRNGEATSFIADIVREVNRLLTSPFPNQIAAVASGEDVVATFASGVTDRSGDTVTPTPRGILNDPQLSLSGVLDWIAAKMIGNRSSRSQIYPDAFFDTSGSSDIKGRVWSRAEFVSAIAKTTAHELAHALGLVHTTGIDETDVMAEGPTPNALSGTATFRTTRNAYSLALGGPLNNTTDIYQIIDEYYRRWESFGYRDSRLPGGGPPQLEPGRSLAIDSDAVGITGGAFDFGITATDPTPATRTLVLRNVGTETVRVRSVTVEGVDGTFTLGGNGAGVVIPSGEVRELAITMNRKTLGLFTGRVIVTSDAAVPVVTIPLFGVVQGMAQTAVVTPDNNFGGAVVGTTVQKAAAAVVTNLGAAPLVVSSVRIVSGGEGFRLVGLPDLTAQPLALAFGQQLQIGAEFTADGLGLRRAVVEVATNDPDRPVTRFSLVGTGTSVRPRPVWGSDFIAVGLFGADPVRLTSGPNGRFSAFVTGNGQVHVRTFDPQRGLIGEGIVPSSRGNLDLTATLLPGASTAPDSDFDGLPDDVEEIIGLSVARADTDSDGVDDFTEIQAGTNPFGNRPAATGVLSQLPVGGAAVGVEVLPSGASALTALVAVNASAGPRVAVADVSDPARPVQVTTLAVPVGSAVALAVDADAGLAAVAGTTGVQLLDVTNPTAPVRLARVPQATDAIALFDGVAYLATNNTLTAVDAITGELLGSVTTGITTVGGMTRDGNFLYLSGEAGGQKLLKTFDLSASTLAVGGSITLTTGGRGAGGGPVFVGDGVAYVGSRRGTAGYGTVSVANPLAPVLLNASDFPTTVGTGFTGMAVAGGGLGLFAGGGGDQPVLDLFDVRTASARAAFRTRFTLPEVPADVAAANGLAFVADGDGGLVVVNYRSADTGTTPPTVTLSVPGVSGTVQEGSTITVNTPATDDVQVRAVELLLNGQVVRTDTSFPYSFALDLPTLAANGGPAVALTARATDTGGNVDESDVINLTLAPDATAPTVLSNTADDRLRGRSLGPIRLVLSDPLAPASVSTGLFRLTAPSGAVVTATSARLTRGGRALVVEFPTLTELGSHQFTVAAGITDRAGNPLAVPAVTVPVVAAVESRFESNTESWGEAGDGLRVRQIATGGNPNGYLAVDDGGGGVVWYFAAPPAFLGSVLSAYGRRLSYDLLITRIDTGTIRGADVILSGGGITLEYEHPADPVAGQWQTLSVTLAPGTGWRNATAGVPPNTPATEADFLTVLANLTALNLRGEYRTGGDTGGLDNVLLRFEPG